MRDDAALTASDIQDQIAANRIAAKADPCGAGNGIWQCKNCGRNILSAGGWCVRCQEIITELDEEAAAAMEDCEHVD